MIDLSGSTDPEIVAAAAVLEVVDTAARAAGVSYLVVGATARNILSVALFRRLPGRATRDIDIAVAVASWDEFRGLTKDFTPRLAHTSSPSTASRSTWSRTGVLRPATGRC